MHLGEGVDTSGTTDEDLSVVLGVDIDKTLMLEHAVLEFHGSGESCLFIDSEQTFDSGMRKRLVRDSRQRHGDTDTVIGSERRAFGLEPLAVHVGPDRVVHEIMLDIAVLLAHHIHVRLEDDAFVVLISRRSGYAHDHIHRFIRHTLDTMCCCEILQPAADSFFVLGRTGYLVDLRENLKDLFTFRFHICSFLISPMP